MRVFALSDIHVDYDINAKWISNLSTMDYREDVLILAGDVTDRLSLLEWCLKALVRRFRQVVFVPGNHDLWVVRDNRDKNSIQKFHEVSATVESTGALMRPLRAPGVTIIPLLSWYDYSFGEPSEELRAQWMDFHACRWPDRFQEKEIVEHFSKLNIPHIDTGADEVITFSHFLPRIDVMPRFIPGAKQILYPVLGSTSLDKQLRSYRPSIHVYGHSHVNRSVKIDGVTYINNAFGYPSETWIASKLLLCIYES